MDLDTLHTVYNKVNSLRVAGKRTKALRAQTQAELTNFEDFDVVEVAPITNPDIAPRTALYISLNYIGGGSSWHCRVFDDWTLYTGISAWSVYDGRPLINPAKHKWKKVVGWMNAVRPYAWHWVQTHQEAICAEGGKGRKRDREAFEFDLQ